ncbi:hypothetical protein CUJ83_09415 [Methanocella sp. CWC-04]|uniref:Uncharacterized protein n=1 Tax=Methanooceanicella nereidis TaxID=2052831 RepID=A0AAP2W580_9EURY|nr:hypothetical protein [Methanocella sp. CWC-04]MCD1295215.1 hypothetical protein [Methanocella sp. CWC-04]
MPKEAKDLKQLFLQKKPCLILLAISNIKKPYVSVLMKEAETTFAHTTNTLSEFESYGLVEFVNEGRVKYVKLTRSGKEVVRIVSSLYKLLNGDGVLKALDRIEKRLDTLEEAIKKGKDDEKAVRRLVKRFKSIGAQMGSLKLEALKYSNDDLDTVIRRMDERIEYIATKFTPEELAEEASEIK